LNEIVLRANVPGSKLGQGNPGIVRKFLAPGPKEISTPLPDLCGVLYVIIVALRLAVANLAFYQTVRIFKALHSPFNREEPMQPHTQFDVNNTI
jgi:hypothetical protein